MSCLSIDVLSYRYSVYSFFFFLMIRRPPRSTLDRSSAASDVYKRQDQDIGRQEGNDPPLRGGIGRPQQQGGDGAEVKDPVSYTHLRAHETVLDLVCRLLLEKKKTRIATTETVDTVS